MKTPKYTLADIAKQPSGGYRTASQTDLRKVFARVRAAQKEAAEIAARNEAEAQALAARNEAEAQEIAARNEAEVRTKVQTLRKERK